MSSYLRNLVARTLGIATVVRPNSGPRSSSGRSAPEDRDLLALEPRAESVIEREEREPATVRLDPVMAAPAGTRRRPAGESTLDVPDAPVLFSAPAAPHVTATHAAERLELGESRAQFRFEACEPDGTLKASDGQPPDTFANAGPKTSGAAAGPPESPLSNAARVERAVVPDVGQAREQRGADVDAGVSLPALDARALVIGRASRAHASADAPGSRTATTSHLVRPGESELSVSRKKQTAEPHADDEHGGRFVSTRQNREAAPAAREDTIVNVTIGRIEVRTPVAPVRAKPVSENARKPVSASTQLADYLRSRSLERR